MPTPYAIWGARRGCEAETGHIQFPVPMHVAEIKRVDELEQLRSEQSWDPKQQCPVPYQRLHFRNMACYATNLTSWMWRLQADSSTVYGRMLRRTETQG